jgi:hypothetical protein
MYLLFAMQIECCASIETFESLEEAKIAFDEKIDPEENDLSYVIGVALYDLNQSRGFGRGDYGFYGEPIEEWENEDC